MSMNGNQRLSPSMQQKARITDTRNPNTRSTGVSTYVHMTPPLTYTFHDMSPLSQEVGTARLPLADMPRWCVPSPLAPRTLASPLARAACGDGQC